MPQVTRLKEMYNATPTRFSGLSKRLGVADEISKNVFADLVSHYAEEHREYHNLLHIDRMLGWLGASGGNDDSIELAIWFHDVIYNPLGHHNEAKSAQYFKEHFGSFISNALVDDVERLIMATDARRLRTGMADENLIIDIDLSILGSSPEDYAAYRDAIRSEYSDVPEADFVVGRRAILERFLSQPIYSTEYFARLESQARVNMERELDNLNGETSF